MQITEELDPHLMMNVIRKIDVYLIDIRVGDLLPPFGSMVPLPECLKGKDYDEVVGQKANGSVETLTFSTPGNIERHAILIITGNPVKYMIEEVETHRAARHRITSVKAIAHLDTPQEYVFLNEDIRTWFLKSRS